MSKPHVPAIKSVMTAFPHAVVPETTLDEARRFMTRHRVQHLPVRDGHELVGVVSDRDVQRMAGSRLARFAEEPLTVADAMSEEAYTVELDEPLDRALSTMADRHLGCVVVTRQGRLAGILTTTDACRLFADFLRRLRPAADPDPDAA